jgi:hypothetical protein
MPAFTAVGAYVAGTLLGLAGTAAVVVGAIVATGAAYITSRVINGNPNKGNNSAAGSQGGRIQVAPATNNKVPVLYGSAYVNGMITDARLKSIGGTTNDTMYYCIVLSEYTNNLTASPVYGLESVIWNDLRLTPVDATTNAHKVKDGRKVVDGAIVTAGSFVVGKTYVITKLGTTTQANWNTIAGTAGKVYDLGAIFTCANAGTGTGQAQEEDFIDTNFIVDNNSLVELRVYAGGSDDSNQIYPPQSTGNTANAYTFWANNDGSWTSANEMKGLVFAIIKLTYAGDKGFTGLPNVTFQLSNNVANPADVWYDYMTSQRYGAGIDPAYIDTDAKDDWYNFCEEDITYTNKAGETNQLDIRYQINGIVDTSRQVKTNIDTILQNGGAWMSYNVATGLWSPLIKKAITAGIPGDSATYFTASRNTSQVITVSAFPSGRIEPGQTLWSVISGVVASRGSIVSQITPLTAGETIGQKGRYLTTGATTALTNVAFYTLAPNLLEFSDDNIISGITLSSTRLDDLYNEVEAEFYDRYNKDQKAYARTDLPSIQRNPNEPDNQLRMSLDLVNSNIQADILSQLEMRQSRDDLVIEFTTNHYGIQTQAGDIINVTSDLYDWAPKQFRVMRVKEIEGDDGSLTAQIQALEYNPDVYTIEPITEFSTAANIGIGNLVSSVGLPQPTTPVISGSNPDASVPNFTFSIDIPATGGPFDEAEIYFAEGWDPNSVTGWIDNNSTPGTYSGVAGNIMTVTGVTYNSINPGDYFDLGGVTVVSQLTQTTISTKTFASGGAPGAFTVTLNNATNVVIGQKPGLNSPAVGIPADAMVVGVSGNTVTLDKAFTVQASGNYNFTTAGGTGTYTVNTNVAAVGTDDLFDQPVDSDFRYLKKIVPDGNASAFESGSTISTIITELPANSQTFRRYFLKARLGVKKNFGSFSPNTPVDIDGNSIPWSPNPSASGGSGVFGDIEIAVETPTTISVTGNNNFITISQTSTSTNVPQNGLRISVESTGTPAAGFGTNLEFEVEVQPGVKKQAGLFECKLTDVTATSEDAKMEFTLMTAGSETPYVSPQLTLENNGNLTTVGHFRTSLNDTTSPRGVGGVTATNDYWFVGGYAVGATPNAGAMVIASGNNGTEPIYVRQYTGPANPTTTDFPGTNTYINELTLLDASGNTILPVSLALEGSTSGSVKFTAPAVAGSQTYVLPTADGTNGYALTTNGSGILSWAPAVTTSASVLESTYTFSPSGHVGRVKRFAAFFENAFSTTTTILAVPGNRTKIIIYARDLSGYNYGNEYCELLFDNINGTFTTLTTSGSNILNFSLSGSNLRAIAQTTSPSGYYVLSMDILQFD